MPIVSCTEIKKLGETVAWTDFDKLIWPLIYDAVIAETLGSWGRLLYESAWKYITTMALWWTVVHQGCLCTQIQ